MKCPYCEYISPENNDLKEIKVTRRHIECSHNGSPIPTEAELGRIRLRQRGMEQWAYSNVKTVEN